MGPLLYRRFRDAETRLHELNYLFWECTTRCNLRCRHCGSDCFMESLVRDMPLEAFLGALDTIPRTHRPENFTVVLTGGEPLLRPDIAKAGKSISLRGFRWGMVSNGYFYDAPMQEKLLDAGMGSLTISLDGLEGSHNWMRGREGSFARTVSAITLAASAPKLTFDVVTCVNRRNFGELERIYSLLSGLGVRRWRIFTVIPIGRAAGDPDMMLTGAELLSLMRFIEAKRKEKGPLRVMFSCEGYLGKFDDRVRDNRHFCRAGINIASILIDGSISACPNVDRSIFTEGNIYKDNFWNVWQNGFASMRDREWLRRGSCADCKLWRDCLGGGLHNWHGDCAQTLDCHYGKINAI